MKSEKVKSEQTLCHLSVLLDRQAEKYGDSKAFVYKDFGGRQWKWVSWKEAALQTGRVSAALLSLGVGVQENIAIFSPNALQYLYTDFGAWGIRACTVPFYATSSEDQIAFMVNDAGIRFMFVGEQEQYNKARRLFAVCPRLEKLIVYSEQVRISTHDPLSIYFDDFLRLGGGNEGQAEAMKVQATDEDLMSILYTSGTTGTSKGVMLTHGQARAALEANGQVLKVGREDRILNFLPYTHIFEKGWSLLCMTKGCVNIILTDPHQVQDAMRETQPTCMSSVPRFWEKVYAGINSQIEHSSALRKKLFQRALEVGRKHNIEYLSRGKQPPVALALEYSLMDRSVFSIIRKKLGLVNPNFFPTAGAAVSPVVEEFIHSIGLFMMVGYGLTESFATASCDHTEGVHTMGSIGRPLPGLEIAFSDEGEILLKGPTITKGYYNRPDLNAKAFTDAGYFRTGDVGYMKEGELYITDRIKDLQKTSNGKYIAPQAIESKILVDRFVEQICVIANERKFVSALIVPTYSELEEWAREKGIRFENREQLCSDERVNLMMETRMDTLQQSLATYEQIKRFVLLPHHFSMERGELTSTLKIKRNVVVKNYKEQIDKMYS